MLVDAAMAADFAEQYFDPGYWRALGELSVASGGRGTVFFARTADRDWALRHYRRGGLVGRWLDDVYLWQGADRTRAFREWRLLASLREAGLPVPRPVAARYRRRGPTYTADLVTQRIPGAVPLSQVLARSSAPADIWSRVGACVRRFHDAGVYHADLTAHNLLVDEAETVHLLDFDRGRVRGDGRWKAANLARLERSLAKIRREDPRIPRPDWSALLAAYSRP
jgi:3-deoxy-D-manno-octulosonic acid kinase